MGFSQRSIFSLLIAAEVPGAAAVVAYYPLADFEGWLDNPDYWAGKRLAFRFIRRRFYAQSGDRSEDEVRRLLARASPLCQAAPWDETLRWLDSRLRQRS